MTRVLWTPQARTDLRKIHDYVARDSLQYATLVVAELLGAVRRLHSFPKSGRVLPERDDPSIREVLWRNYRIVYRLLAAEDAVHVLTVFRGERLFPAGVA